MDSYVPKSCKPIGTSTETFVKILSSQYRWSLLRKRVKFLLRGRWLPSNCWNEKCYQVLWVVFKIIDNFSIFRISSRHSFHCDRARTNLLKRYRKSVPMLIIQQIVIFSPSFVFSLGSNLLFYDSCFSFSFLNKDGILVVFYWIAP